MSRAFLVATYVDVEGAAVETDRDGQEKPGLCPGKNDVPRFFGARVPLFELDPVGVAELGDESSLLSSAEGGCGVPLTSYGSAWGS